MKEHLLNILVRHFNKEYISDLRSITIQQLLAEIKYLDVDCYSIEEWNRTLDYIIGENIIIQNTKEIYPKLQQQLDKF